MIPSMRRDDYTPHPLDVSVLDLSPTELVRMIGYWINDRETATMSPAELRALADQFTEQAHRRLNAARCAMELANRFERVGRS